MHLIAYQMRREASQCGTQLTRRKKTAYAKVFSMQALKKDPALLYQTRLQNELPEGFLQPPGSVKILMMNDIFDGDFRDRTVSILNTREMDRPAMREWNVGKR